MELGFVVGKMGVRVWTRVQKEGENIWVVVLIDVYSSKRGVGGILLIPSTVEKRSFRLKH